MKDREEIAAIVKLALRGVTIKGKAGQKILQPKLVGAFNRAGYQADSEDFGTFLQSKMPVWRSKNTKRIEVTKARRKIDIVVRLNNVPVALIETESDLNDLRVEGVTKRNGHYDVFSIARSSNGEYFHSYKSLERMAAAAFYYQLPQQSESYPKVKFSEFALARLESIESNDPAIHNPAQLPMFLVTGKCRASDRNILKPRLDALSADLLTPDQ